MLLIALAAAQPIPPMPPCFDDDPRILWHKGDLPAAAWKALPWRIADRDEWFSTSDVVSSQNPPPIFRRFVCAKADQDGYLVEVEYGGIAHGTQTVRLRLARGQWTMK